MHSPAREPNSVWEDSWRLGARAVLLVALIVGGIAAYWQFGDPVRLESLVAQENRVREFHQDWPLVTIAAALGVYIAVAAIVPGAMFLTLAYGWFFGFWTALVIVSFGSTAGATLAFLASRYIAGETLPTVLQRRVTSIRSEFDKDGAYYLFTLRLLPAVPFFLVNLGMGVTRIRTWTFWWVSQLGMLPGTAAYVYAGASLPSLQQLVDEGVRGLVNWRLLAALAVVGLLPLALKKSIAAFRSKE